ncbi:hypothetical protein GJAV_G00169240 [Gymnothorax javanicus]|nr:hypothetical protein GJAV_G00169240 [Gymnothorax javanicus]
MPNRSNRRREKLQCSQDKDKRENEIIKEKGLIGAQHYRRHTGRLDKQVIEEGPECICVGAVYPCAVLQLCVGEMTAEWLHLPPPYPPGVGPLCGAELEAWYEDLQDILGSDGGGAKPARVPPGPEKEPEFLDVLESCSLTWLTDGQGWGGEGAQRVVEEGPQPQGPTPILRAPAKEEREAGAGGGASGGGGSDLLPPEFFELLSDGGAGLMEGGGGGMEAGGTYAQQHHRPPSPTPSDEEPPSVPDSSSCCSSSSASQSPTLHHSPPPSPLSPPPAPSYRLGKRRRGGDSPAGPASSAGSASLAKKSRKEREQENERKVQELTEQNERLKAEIERLAEEVQRTRRSLIERLVNTRK